jgi:hypothetical protein
LEAKTMAVKKSATTAEKKTRTAKAPAKRAAAARAAEPAVEAAEKRVPSYDDVAQLAEQFWVERGRPYGSPEVDWLRAEATLHA